MGLADKAKSRRETKQQITDTVIAEQIEMLLSRQIMQAREALGRVQTFLNQAPGGRAGIVTAMGGQDFAECQQICNALKSVVNTHKQTGSPAAPDPLA